MEKRLSGWKSGLGVGQGQDSKRQFGPPSARQLSEGRSAPTGGDWAHEHAGGAEYNAHVGNMINIRGGFQMTNMFKIGFAVFLFGSTATGALAQTVPADESEGFGDIVVTARKTSEKLQDVPDSISVLTSDALSVAGANSITDVANLVPNLTFDPQATPGGLNLSIRGVTMAQGAEAPIAFVIDGIQVPDPIFMNQSLLNVTQVEVLRGPQGSLYGRNALAGVIILETKMPSEALEGGVLVRYGNGDDRYIQGDVSGPLVADKLMFSLGASYNRFDGLRENAFLNQKWDTRKNYDFRGRLLFKPTDNLTFDLRASHGKAIEGQEGVELVPSSAFDDFSQPYMSVNAPLVSRVKLTDISLKADLDLESVTLTSITDWNRVRSILTGDGDFSSTPLLLQRTTRPINSWSQELRLSSNSSPSDSFKWLIGGFYQNRKTVNGLQIPFDNGVGQPTNVLLIDSQDFGRSKSWAVFGQATYKLTEALDVTAGARYDSDRRASVDANVPGSAVSNTFNEFQPKATMAYHFSEDGQIYATYSRGFRSGGFNAFFSVGGFDRQYGAQVNDNYEIGGKLMALGGKLFISGAIYRTDIKNNQLFFINTNPPSQNIVIIDRSHVNGGELSVSARITRDLNFNANLGIADTVIDRFAPQPSAVGNHAPIAPLYTLGANFDYTIHLDDDTQLVAYAGWNRRGKTYWDVSNSRSTPAKDLVDARLTLEHGGWRLTGFVKNLLDEQYPVQALVDAFGPGVDGRAISMPRTYGVEVGFRF